MAESDLHHVEALFQSAADLPANRRAAYLDEACNGDASLRAQVEALLARLDRDSVLTSPLDRQAAGARSIAAITEGPGAVIGRYKLLQVIGEGGFGVVYMAEQQQPVVRKVALKIIKLGMDTREVVARFEAERQALALMDHPNIAKVLDGGATASGRPYFVMELVRGVAITEFCDKNDLATRLRLELFVLVCHALQHAHQKGVIHRDLKPSNVLVTLHDGHPVPKVIDFGVAKAMHTRLTEKTLFTRYEQFIGTPAYMSPEQAEMSALDVDTRTDIYSLGVLLYELLTGTTPFDAESLSRAGVAEIQRIIREEQPPRPSLRISTTGDADVARHRRQDVPGLTRLLRGDLDWVVMRALEKERSRRYGAASELADDVDRYLRKEPVVAGPPGATYRARKFLARNRAAVGSALLLALVLVVGIVGTTLGMVESKRHADLAQEQAGHALSALDFLVSTLSLTNPEVALDPEVTVLTLLGGTSARVSEAFAGQPWAEARVRATIGRAYTMLSEPELAEPQLRRTVDLVDALLAESPSGALDWPGFDAGDFYTTLWTLTNVCFNLERGDAFVMASRAHQVGIAHLATVHPELAEHLDRLTRVVTAGAWSLEPGAMDDVPDLFAKAAASADATLQAGDPMWPIVADRFLAAGYTIWYTPHEPLAERFWTTALAIQERELPPENPEVARTVGLLVDILNNLDRSAEAEQLIRDSLAALRRVHREDDFPVALAESTLGENLVRQGRYAEAAPLLEHSHEIILSRVKNPANFLAVESLVRLLRLYDDWGRPDAATVYREQLAAACARGTSIMPWSIAVSVLDPDDPLRGPLARVHELCGGVSYLAAPGGRHAPDLAPLLPDLATQLNGHFAPTDPRAATIARSLIGWANSLEPEAHLEARLRLATIARDLLHPGWSDLLTTDYAESLAIIAATTGGDEARRKAREAWRVIRNAKRHRVWFAATADIRIGRILYDFELYEEAETLLENGHAVLVAQLGAGHEDTRYARGTLFDLYTAWGRPDEAERYASTPPPGE